MQRRSVLKGMAAAGLAGGLGLAAPRAFAAPKPGRWLRLESASFSVYSADDEGDARQDVAALEAFNGLLRKLMPALQDGGAKLPVYFAQSSRDFKLANPSLPENVAGFYSPGVEEIRAVVAVQKGQQRQREVTRDARAFDERVILFHEYVHHFMYATMRQPFPAWYVEGFAEFLSTAEFGTDGVVQIGKPTRSRAVWLVNGRWLDIGKFLTTSRTRDLSEDDASMFYAQAWLAVHYLFNTPGRGKGFDAYIKALTDGGDLIGAFQPAFGMTPADFDKELRSYRHRGLALLRLPGHPIDASIPLKLERLPQSADDLLMPASYARGRPDVKAGADTLEEIRDRAKTYPDDPLAMRAQATAEIWLGDLAVARRLLDRLLVLDAQNAEAQHLSGLCDLRAGYAAGDEARIAAAAPAFAAAYRIDPARASSLFRYCEVRLRAPTGFDDHVLDTLFSTWRIAPQVPAISLLLAQGLMRRDRSDEAVLVLRPLAADVHRGVMADTAGDLLAKALAKQPPGPLNVFGAAGGG